MLSTSPTHLRATAATTSRAGVWDRSRGCRQAHVTVTGTSTGTVPPIGEQVHRPCLSLSLSHSLAPPARRCDHHAVHAHHHPGGLAAVHLGQRLSHKSTGRQGQPSVKVGGCNLPCSRLCGSRPDLRFQDVEKHGLYLKSVLICLAVS
jgi:hypothetical protein